MKYLSLIVVIVFIAFTFWVSRKSEDLSIDQVNKMNTMISQYMTQAVQNNQPNVTEIEFSKMYTEVVEAGKVMRAHFSFSYTEQNAQGELEKVYRKGTFLITSEDGDNWKAQIEEAGDVKVEYLVPFEITASGEVQPLTDPNQGESQAPSDEGDQPVADEPAANEGQEETQE